MNLMKFFNLKFLKENIKKSNGVLLFLVFIIPVFNIITIFMNLKQNHYIVNFIPFNIINYIGALILPIIIAYSLNKYLFKQNSVDFYLSKPINRCKLYFSNLLGGFFLIFCLIFLNSIIFLLFGLFTNMLLPFSFILDYFIYFLILYFFVYIIATLSISITGNFITALIVAMIIMWMPMVISYGDKVLYDNYNQTYLKVSSCNTVASTCVNENNEYKYKVIAKKNISASLSLPSSFILKNEFNMVDVIKTIILSIIYVFLGYIAFRKRKMENNNIGFANEIVHYIVKTITIIPLAFIVSLFIKEKDLLTSFLILIVAFIYSIIYDIFTRKNNYNGMKSVIIFIWTFVLLCFVNFGLIGLYSRNVTLSTTTFTYKNLYVDDIVYEINNFDFIERIEQANDIVSEDFYIPNSNIRIMLNIPTDVYNKLHEKDYEDYRKYANNYNYKLVNGAYLDFEKLDVSKLNFKNIKTTKDENDKIIDLYSYKNHKFDYFRISIDANKDILKYVIKYFNEKFIKNKDEILNRVFIPYDYSENVENSQILRYILTKYPDVLKNYLIEHYNDNVQDDYMIIDYGFENTFDKVDSYIINDVDNFKDFLNSYKDLCYNEGNCQKE